MKKVFGFAALLLMVTTLSFAKEPKPSETSEVKMNLYFDYNHGKIKTFFLNNTGETITVAFLDQNGNEISKTFIGKKQTKSNINFDINELNDGQYVIKATSKSGVETSKQVTVTTSRPQKQLKF